jgi:hypothetical protein
MKKILILVAASTLMFACKKENNKEKEYKSQETVLHGGKVWSSAKTDKDGKPLSLSIVLNDAAINTVPVGQPTDHMSHENNLIIPVSEKSGTPFKNIMVNWNSSGHEPDNIYTLPHFDFHFYTLAESEIMNLTDAVKMDENLPATDYVPANYVSPGAGVPMMGRHWIDATSPELGGQTFTQTFLYGSYDNKVIFLEPMITLDFLKNNSNYERSLPQPAKYKTSGYYPTRMRVAKHDGLTEVVIDGFTYRQGS